MHLLLHLHEYFKHENMHRPTYTHLGRVHECMRLYVNEIIKYLIHSIQVYSPSRKNNHTLKITHSNKKLL